MAWLVGILVLSVRDDADGDAQRENAGTDAERDVFYGCGHVCSPWLIGLARRDREVDER
jgi:hypothetical protein